MIGLGIASISWRRLSWIWLAFTALFAVPAFTAPHPAAYPEGYPAGLSRQDIFQQAGEAYRQGEMDKAIAGYRYLADLGIRNGHLCYNLGNSYFRVGEIGQSALWYERALRYLPRFRDLQVNYQFVRSQLTDEDFKAPEYSGTLGFLTDLHQKLNLRESLWVTAILFWLWAATLIIVVWAQREPWKSRVRIPCWIMGFLFIITLLSTGFKVYRYEYRVEAVIMSPAVDVKTGPSPDFSTSFTLHEGTKIIVVQEQNNWVRITLPSNSSFTGWMPEESVEAI